MVFVFPITKPIYNAIKRKSSSDDDDYNWDEEDEIDTVGIPEEEIDTSYDEEYDESLIGDKPKEKIEGEEPDNVDDLLSSLDDDDNIIDMDETDIGNIVDEVKTSEYDEALTSQIKRIQQIKGKYESVKLSKTGKTLTMASSIVPTLRKACSGK